MIGHFQFETEDYDINRYGLITNKAVLYAANLNLENLKTATSNELNFCFDFD